MIGYIFLVVSAITSALICTRKVWVLEKLEEVVVLTEAQRIRLGWYFGLITLMLVITLHGSCEILFRIYGK